MVDYVNLRLFSRLGIFVTLNEQMDRNISLSNNLVVWIKLVYSSETSLWHFCINGCWQDAHVLAWSRSPGEVIHFLTLKVNRPQTSCDIFLWPIKEIPILKTYYMAIVCLFISPTPISLVSIQLSVGFFIQERCAQTIQKYPNNLNPRSGFKLSTLH